MYLQRLAQERKNWRKEHPPDFYAKPKTNPDESTNLAEWEAGIPGPAGTDWEGGVYTLTLKFPQEYPSVPPKCFFGPVIYHPNVFSNGGICLSILNADWSPSVTLVDVLTSIQHLLANPNAKHVTDRPEVSRLYNENQAEYRRKIRDQTKRFTPV